MSGAPRGRRAKALVAVVPMLLVLATTPADAATPINAEEILADRLAFASGVGVELSRDTGPVDSALAVAQLAVSRRGGVPPHLLAGAEPLLELQERNLALSRAILDETRSGATGLDLAAAIADVVSAPDAARAGAATPDLPAEWTAVLAQVPDDQRPAVKEVVSAFVLFEQAASSLFDPTVTAQPLDEDSPDRALRRWRELDVARRPGWNGFVAARSDLVRAVLALREGLAVAPAGASAAAACTRIESPPRFSLDLAGCDSTYTSDVALLIDVGGNDTYLNNAGGGGVSTAMCGRFTRPAAALIDYRGNDAYLGAGCGVNGGGLSAAGFLVDAAGSDLYRTGGYGTNGGGDVGSGFVLDGGGPDRYEAAGMATNGGGMNGGQGLLVDVGGNDVLSAYEGGTNGGGYFGTGRLVNVGGSDSYDSDYQAISYSSASNGGGVAGAGFLLDSPLPSGTDAVSNDVYRGTLRALNGGGYLAGAGFLIDQSGDDYYGPYGDDTLDSGANGGGDVAGVGLLVDTSGSDIYRARSSGVNGGGNGGLGNGVGFLIDRLGDDLYEAGHFGANGGAAADLASVISTGTLIDGGGNDVYRAGAGGTNGGASGSYIGGNAAGLLYDFAGNDSYTAQYSAVNGAGQSYPGVGVGALIDRNGRDVYSETGAAWTDCSVVPKGVAGVLLDVASLPCTRLP